MQYYQNKTLLRDGNVLVYQRSDIKSGIWQARFLINGKYKNTSLKTTNKSEAEIKACDLYDEIRFKIKHGIPVFDLTFKQVVEEFLRNAEERCKTGEITYRWVKVISSVIDNGFYPYFTKDIGITSIQQNKIDGYVAWRKNNNKSGPKISIATLRTELAFLKQIFKYALKKKYINESQMPDIQRIKRSKKDDERRPHFQIYEWRKLTRFLIYWSKHSLEYNQMRYYIHFLAHSGLRTGEAATLTWKQFTWGNDAFRILNVTGKTGSRKGTVVCDIGLGRKMQRWKELTKDLGNDDLIWTLKMDRQRQLWRQIMDKTELYYDERGRSRPLYSLRHTYATFRLTYGRTDVYKLAQNMGTSVQMIENFYGHTETEDFVEDLTRRKNNRHT